MADTFNMLLSMWLIGTVLGAIITVAAFVYGISVLVSLSQKEKKENEKKKE